MRPGSITTAPCDHLIECRAQLDESVAMELRAALPGSFGALGLSLIGWQLRLDPGASDAEIGTLLGLDRAADFADAEEELPALLALLGPRMETGTPKWKRVTRALSGWQGRVNRLSAERVRWPEITRILP